MFARGLAAVTLWGLGLAACGPAAPTSALPVADPTPATDSWQEVFDAVGWPEITAAVRISARSGDRDRVVCVEGWQVPTPRGPMRLFDDLHVDWGATQLEDWPVSQRVAVERYDAVVDLSPWRRVRSGRGRIVREFRRATTADFLRSIVGQDCARPVSGPTTSRSLFFVARARWAQMLGRPDLVAAQIEAASAEFVVDDAMYDEVARVLHEQAKFGLSQGMRRRQARAMLERGLALARDPERRAEIVQSLDHLGRDLPPVSTSSSPEALAAALPNEPFFPARRWAPEHARPRWARDGTQQPLSPAWELVARGWEALPALRAVSRSETLPRQSVGVITREGTTRLSGVPPGRTALQVAAAIAGRSFANADELDRWWDRVGHRGREVAMLDAIEQADERVAVVAVMTELLRAPPTELWTVLADCLAADDHPARPQLLATIATAVAAGQLDHARGPVRRLAHARLRDADPAVRLAAAHVLLAADDPAGIRAGRRALRGLLAVEVIDGVADPPDGTMSDPWWDLVDALEAHDPEGVRALLRLAQRRGSPDVRDVATDLLAHYDETPP